jgi:tetratricopeptide (TPR) repeat protein
MNSFELSLKSKCFISLFAVLTFFLMSCGNGTKETDPNAKLDSLPPELAALTKAIQEKPTMAVLYQQRAQWYLENQLPDNALTDINKAIELDDKVPAYYRTLSDVYFSMGKSQKCRDALNKAIEINVDDTASYLKLAELEFYFQEYKKTFDLLDKTLQLDPENAKAFFIRGMAYKEMGDTAKAVRALQIAVEKDQEYYHAYMQLGLLYAQKHNPLAVDYFNNALNLNPKSIETYYALAMYYQENEEYNKAIETYTMLLKIDPKYKFAHFNLGYIHLVYLRVYDVAAKHFTDAINVDKNYAEAWYNRGYSYELLGDVMKAKSDYQQAIMIKPNYQRAVDGLNRVDALIKK